MEEDRGRGKGLTVAEWTGVKEQGGDDGFHGIQFLSPRVAVRSALEVLACHHRNKAISTD
jgi:hypothetical protein